MTTTTTTFLKLKSYSELPGEPTKTHIFQYSGNPPQIGAPAKLNQLVPVWSVVSGFGGGGRNSHSVERDLGSLAEQWSHQLKEKGEEEEEEEQRKGEIWK